MTDHERQRRNNELAAYASVLAHLSEDLKSRQECHARISQRPDARDWSRFLVRMGFEITALHRAIAAVEALIVERSIAKDE